MWLIKLLSINEIVKIVLFKIEFLVMYLYVLCISIVINVKIMIIKIVFLVFNK